MTMPASVFGLQFYSLDLKTLADRLTRELPEGNEAHMLFTVNLDHVIHLRKNRAFRAAHERAKIITADGMPVYLYARLRGFHLERITGADLLPALMERFSPARHRLFFITSDKETAERIEAMLKMRGFDGSSLATVVPPFGFEKDPDYSSRLARCIKNHCTTHLVMGVGAPKSEIWLDVYRKQIGSCHAFPFGSAPNFLVGTATRAPRWMRTIGCEWLWRVGCEPRRLFRRYFIDSWEFLAAISDDLMTDRT